MWLLTETVPRALVNLSNACSIGLEEGQLVGHMANGETVVLVDLPVAYIGERFDGLVEELRFKVTGGIVDLHSSSSERELESRARHED